MRNETLFGGCVNVLSGDCVVIQAQSSPHLFQKQASEDLEASDSPEAILKVKAANDASLKECEERLAALYDEGDLQGFQVCPWIRVFSWMLPLKWALY